MYRGATIYYSSDGGITWNASVSGIDNTTNSHKTFRSIAYGNGVWNAVNDASQIK
jgi:hypothetical protein